MKSPQKGQAALEWIMYSAAIFGLWLLSMTLAQRLLSRTVAQSVSVLTARQALSGAPQPRVSGTAVLSQGLSPRGSHATVMMDQAWERYRIEIPQKRKDRWFFSFPYFGSLFSPSSE